MPEQFDRLTPGELMLLQEHHLLEHEFQQETAAFSGYCSGLAFGMAWNGKLESFDKFFARPKPNVPPPKSRAEKFRDGCRMLGLKAGKLTDEQISLA